MSPQSPTDSPSRHITVVDVYDLAASIGNDFERIIDQFGNDSVRQMMPKVISALETLESLANHNEKENEEILMLRKMVERLEKEKEAKKEDRIKFEMELEAVEDSYRKEIDNLWAMVKSLQSANKRLLSTSDNADISPGLSMGSRDEDLKVMLELRDLSNVQKEQIRELQNDVNTYNCELENLQNSVEKLIRQNEELLRKNASLQKQGRVLVEERSEIIKRLQSVEETNIKLNKMFRDATRQCKDLQQYQMEESDSAPRFTLAELREVLQEKNLLKGKVMELEEELEQFRPSDLNESVISDSNREVDRFDTSADECIVYGPINKEPEEKLYPWKYERKDSGVRKFFRFFFKDGLSGDPYIMTRGSSSPIPPTRTMSSLSSHSVQSPR